MKSSLLTCTMFYIDKGGIQSGGTRYQRKAVFFPVQTGCATEYLGTWQQYPVLLVIASSGQCLASEFFLLFGLWDGVTVQLQFHLETGGYFTVYFKNQGQMKSP